MSHLTTARNSLYARYAGSREWSAIDQALLKLIDNRDLEETTAHEYVVGYLCQALESAKGLDGAQTAANSMDTGDLERHVAILDRTRHAIRLANPQGRDLVQELIDERRQEAACE